MTTEACALEPYHQPPDEEELLGCVRKQLVWHHAPTKKARAADPAAKIVDLPLQWILSSGRPAKVIERFELAPLGESWPTGIYTAVRWLRLRLVVISELPRTPDTLLLRLLGAGVTLRTAIQELAALPPDAWERVVVGPLIVQFRLALPTEPSQRTPEEEELMITAQEYIRELEQKSEQAGQRRGQAEGQRTLLAHQVERRLRRPLSDAERTALHGRMENLGAEHVSDLVIELSPDALATWLAEATAA